MFELKRIIDNETVELYVEIDNKIIECEFKLVNIKNIDEKKYSRADISTISTSLKKRNNSYHKMENMDYFYRWVGKIDINNDDNVKLIIIDKRNLFSINGKEDT